MKDLRFARLLELYGCMLTEKQRCAAEAYYWEDMSLSEIAEEMGITRQGVRENIKHGEQTLEDMEKKLMLMKKTENVSGIFEEIGKLAALLPEKPKVTKEIQMLAEKGRDIFS